MHYPEVEDELLSLFFNLWFSWECLVEAEDILMFRQYVKRK